MTSWNYKLGNMQNACLQIKAQDGELHPDCPMHCYIYKPNPLSETEKERSDYASKRRYPVVKA